MRSFTGTPSVLILLLLVLIAVTSFFWTPYTQEWIDLPNDFAPPSAWHWLGQGENGIDIFSHIMLGLRNSMFLSMCVSLFAALVGTFLGMWTAWQARGLDKTFNKFLDLMASFPSLIVYLLIAIFLGQGFLAMFIALFLSSWPNFTRIIRAQSLSTIKEAFVEAAVAQGASVTRLLLRHILPQLWPTVLFQVFVLIRRVIVTEATLSFLGVGFRLETASLGRLAAQGKDAFLWAPHVMLFTGSIFFVLLLSVISVSDKVQRLWIQTKTGYPEVR